MPGLFEGNEGNQAGRMELYLWVCFRTNEYISTRQTTGSKTKGSCLDMRKPFKYIKNSCLDCNNHVPVYLNFYCEECWKKHLNAKLVTDDAKKIISKKD